MTLDLSMTLSGWAHVLCHYELCKRCTIYQDTWFNYYYFFIHQPFCMNKDVLTLSWTWTCQKGDAGNWYEWEATQQVTFPPCCLEQLYFRVWNTSFVAVRFQIHDLHDKLCCFYIVPERNILYDNNIYIIYNVYIYIS